MATRQDRRRRPRSRKSHRGPLQLALFYSAPSVERAFRKLSHSGDVVLHGFPLSCWEQDNWDHDGGFDAIVVEQSRDASRERALLRRLRKSFPRVPLIAFVARSKETPSSMDNNRTGFSLHLSGVPSVEGLRSHLRAAERHAELSKKSSTLARRFRETSLRLQVLSDIVSTANSILEPERVLGVIMSQIQKLIPSEAWSILLVDEQRKELTFEMALGEKGEEFSDIRLKIGEGIAGWVARTGKPVIVNDVSRDPRFQGRFDEQTQFRTRAVLCAPLVSRGRTIGVVEILNRASGRRFTKRDLKLLLTLVEPAAIALENAILFKTTEWLAVSDDLTKLYNSRYLNSFLSRELSRARRHRTSLALIFLDLDGFKVVNDQHGHLCGSRTLFEVGAIIKQAVRDEDMVCRYGGDEFVVVLPDTGTEGAFAVANRIRRALKSHRFLPEHGLSVSLSASFGVSCFPEHGATPQDLIQKADQAMYSVKQKGKDGVEMAL